MTVVVGGALVAALPVELLLEGALDAVAGRNLERDAEREVRRCFASGASGDTELASNESWLMMSVSSSSS